MGMTQARPPVVLGNGEGDGRTRRVAAVSMVVEFVSREVRGELGGLRLQRWRRWWRWRRRFGGYGARARGWGGAGELAGAVGGLGDG